MRFNTLIAPSIIFLSTLLLPVGVKAQRADSLTTKPQPIENNDAYIPCGNCLEFLARTSMNVMDVALGARAKALSANRQTATEEKLIQVLTAPIKLKVASLGNTKQDTLILEYLNEIIPQYNQFLASQRAIKGLTAQQMQENLTRFNVETISETTLLYKDRLAALTNGNMQGTVLFNPQQDLRTLFVIVSPDNVSSPPKRAKD
jgi:hypothetical protein